MVPPVAGSRLARALAPARAAVARVRGLARAASALVRRLWGALPPLWSFLTDTERWAGRRAWLARSYLLVLGTLALFLSPLWVWMIGEVVVALWVQIRDPIPDAVANPDARRAYFWAIGLTITGLGALLAAPFVLIRTWVNERLAQTTEQGHVTDRIAKAVDQLGAEKTVKRPVAKEYSGRATEEATVPNLAVRLGGIYALERIALDSERDRNMVLETLSAYLRIETTDAPTKGGGGPLRPDVEAVLSVLTRRGW